MNEIPVLGRPALRRLVVRGLTAGAAALVVLPTVTAVALTGIDLVKRRGRKQRPAQRPGTFHVEAGESSVSIFTSGEELFEAMIAAIDDARESVKLETYIWKGDETGQRFMDAVNRAAERGVRVLSLIHI